MDEFYMQKVKLGQGSFGTVWRAVRRGSDPRQYVAIKQMPMSERVSAEAEVKFMIALKHPNILECYRAWTDDVANLFVALEYGDSDLGDRIRENPGVGDVVLADWFCDISRGLQFIHSRHVVHRDIKPENVVMNDRGCKIADFGLAVQTDGNLLYEAKGTPEYRSPENCSAPSLGYSTPTDVWAMGVTLYQSMHGGNYPFLNECGVADPAVASQGLRGRQFLDTRSDNLKLLAIDMTNPDATSRCTAAAAFSAFDNFHKSSLPAEAPGAAEGLSTTLPDSVANLHKSLLPAEVQDAAVGPEFVEEILSDPISPEYVEKTTSDSTMLSTHAPDNNIERVMSVSTMMPSISQTTQNEESNVLQDGSRGKCGTKKSANKVKLFPQERATLLSFLPEAHRASAMVKAFQEAHGSYRCRRTLEKAWYRVHGVQPPNKKGPARGAAGKRRIPEDEAAPQPAPKKLASCGIQTDVSLTSPPAMSLVSISSTVSARRFGNAFL